MAWSLVQSGSFTNADTATGAAGNTTAVPGWTDNAGSLWHIASNQASAAAPNLNYGTNVLLRPSAETAIGSRIFATFTATSNNAQLAAVLRWTSNAAHYLLAMDPVGHNIGVYRATGANAYAQIGTSATGVTLTAGHVYTLEFYASGSSPTSLFAQLIDTTSSTTLSTFGPTNDSSGSQVTGQQGLSAVSGSETGPILVTSAATYTGSSAAGASISLSPTSVTGMATGVSVAITGTSTSFTGSPFSISGGLGAYQSAQSVTDTTHGTITINPGVQGNGLLTVTDAASGATASLTVNAPSLGALKVGFIGDSITAGTNGSPTAAVGTYLTGMGYTPTITNGGVGGSQSAQWVPGQTNYTNAKAAFASAGSTIVHVMLGTNDYRAYAGGGQSALTPAQHFANMRLIVNDLVASGYIVDISKSPWIVPNTTVNGTLSPPVPNNENDLILQGWVLDQQLIDNVKVFAGDTAYYSMVKQAPTTYLATDGVHPLGATSNNLLGTLWAIAISERYGAPQRYRGGFIRTT